MSELDDQDSNPQRLMPLPPEDDCRRALSTKPSKPIDRWLALAGIALGVILYLLAKTALIVIVGCLLVFALLIHPVWNFWWIEDKRYRQIIAASLLAVLVVGIAYAAWPLKVSPEQVTAAFFPSREFRTPEAKLSSLPHTNAPLLPTTAKTPEAEARKFVETLPESLSNLARGWTLHRQQGVLSIYFFMNEDRIDKFLASEIPTHGDRPVPENIRPDVEKLFDAVAQRCPQPEPYRTPLGASGVKQRLIEHVVHEFNDPTTGQTNKANFLACNYELILGENAGYQSPPPHNIEILSLSKGNQKTVVALDCLAVETINRAYVDTLERLRH